ncbi:hypothetical protein ACH95_01260 [Bacillus glycinifermentans]|uniref:DUF5316 domain-containing protein n=1 Tax=Bacillus glycinifermentans TaxID=1664069 RepID=A0A0J6F2G3_9BACI|nr:DUF5316 domain-containing protein [Bacillus glycinifermentans]ATH93416.1 hypothetical protein COP00_12980 [Bacillus glycinifermentans]KMM63480.1 hypothetical protein ACH95_01260 [Bacillus glycinifermentans]KRT90420.1 hypothetical protein AB447_207530 [Bacillus glycinifermentans]MEC0484125.1 DUF5316 domain-containing protein [Bacillus glycinifermentans]MEC0494239.1 DUF5316 domain-containing protein [Bacillus glycinifermentans]
MKTAFLTGVAVCLVSIVISFAAEDWTLVFKISGTAGLGAGLLSALFSGAFVSGDRFRGNHHSETEEHRRSNHKMTNALAFFAIPNLLAAGVSFFFAF